MNLRRLFPVWPLVLDTNILRREVLRRVRRPGESTRIAGGLALRTIRVVTTPHVIAEMDEHIREFACEGGVDPDEAARVWWREYRSELTVVNVDGLLRDHVLVQRVTDPDDVPLGVLATLLGVRALSADTDLGELASGEDAWLRHIIAATDAGLGETVLHGMGLAIFGGVKGICSGVSRVHGYFSRQVGRDFADFLAFGAGVGLLFALAYEPSRSALLQSDFARWMKSAGNQLLGMLVDAAVKGQQGREFLDGVAVAEASPRLEMVLARVLVSSASPVPLDEVAAAVQASRVDVEAVLHRYPAFVRDEFGAWKLGYKLQAPATIVDAPGWRETAPPSWFATPLLPGPSGAGGPFAVPLSGIYPDFGR